MGRELSRFFEGGGFGRSPSLKGSDRLAPPPPPVFRTYTLFVPFGPLSPGCHKSLLLLNNMGNQIQLNMMFERGLQISVMLVFYFPFSHRDLENDVL